VHNELAGKQYVKSGTFVESGRNRDFASEVSNDGADLRKPNTLTRLILRASSPKQFKNPLQILIRNPPAVISDFNGDPIAPYQLGPHHDPQWAETRAVLNCIVEEVAENLLQ
jgi:hypothetical protein